MKKVLKDLLAPPTDAERAGPLRVGGGASNMFDVLQNSAPSQEQMRHLMLRLQVEHCTLGNVGWAEE